MKKSKLYTLASLFFIIFILFNFYGIAYAESLKYCYAYPSEQFIGKEVEIHWNFEYSHNTIIEISDDEGDIIFKTYIPKNNVNGNFLDNNYSWYGRKTNGALASPGFYSITVYSDDEYRIYKSYTSVTLKELPKEPELNITIQSPITLTPNGNNYEENSFVVQAMIKNSGDELAENVKAKISRTSGLWLVDGGDRNIGIIQGGETKKVTWRVSADTKLTRDRTETITINVTSSNANTASKIRQINVPGLAVIFIPGLMGTDLKKTSDNKQVWYNFWGTNDYEAMQLNDDGTSVNAIAPIKPMDYAYEDIIKYLKDNGFNVISYPYDWRLDNDYSAQKLKDLISNVGASKVYIVAHSMGGIVANRYIGMGYANKVAKLITIGTPYLGSPKALYGIETGDLVPFTSDNGIQSIAVRSKAAYQLLPSREYFNLGTYYFSKGYINSNGKLDSNEYADYKQMLDYLNNNHPVLLKGFAQSADNFQQKLNLNITSVDAYNIVGYGLNTIGKIQEKFVYSKQKNKWILTEVKKMNSINGDETVPFISANRSKIIGRNHTWYVEDVGHMNLVSDENVQNQIKAILTGIDKNYLSTTFKLDKRSYSLTINSPVDLQVYDVNGKHLGFGANGKEVGIPLASYYEWDHNKFAFLREGQYNIQLNATDTGTFTFTVDYYNGEEIENSVLFKDVPVQKGAVITSKIIDYQSKDLVLTIDNENDGIIDAEVLPTSILDSTGASDLTPPTVSIRAEGTKGKNNWFNTDAMVYLDAYDEGGSNLKSVEYQLNEGDFLPYALPLPFNNEGLTTIKAIAMDGAGNTSLNLVSEEIKVDKTLPIILSNLQSEYSFGTVLNLVYEIQVIDAVSGLNNYKIYYDGNLITNDTITLNQDGYHMVKVIAEDNAGLIQTYEKTFEVYIPATINFDPDTLNIKNDNPAVATVYIEFPIGFNVNDIDLSSILLNNLVAPIQDPQFGYVQNPVGDYNGDGKEEFMVKFRRTDLVNVLTSGENIQILMTGRASGILFKGKDFIRVIN